MKKRIMIALAAVMLMSGCSGGGNSSSEVSNVNNAGSEKASVSGSESDVSAANPENEANEQNASAPKNTDPDSDCDIDLLPYDGIQSNETSGYTFGDLLERDND